MSWSAHASEEDAREFFDSEAELDAKVRRMADSLRKAKHAIIFTGAGIATSAGIPDFRSGMNTVLPTGPGLWERRAHEERSSAPGPRAARLDLDGMLKAEPTLTHRAIQKLVELGVVKYLISQNVDGMHRRSGVPADKIAELHGNLALEACTLCGKEYLRNFRVGPNKGMNHMTGRSCDDCSGPLREFLVPFGEQLPERAVNAAYEHSDAADFCLALGSSLTVTPASDYPRWVGEKASQQRLWSASTASPGELFVVNLQATPLDGCATRCLHGMCDDVMRKLLKELDIVA